MASTLLDLSHHCIETAARLALRERTAELLATADPAPSLVAEIALLQRFLSSHDFAALRSATR